MIYSLVVGFIFTGVVIFVWSVRKALIAPQRQKWLSHNIRNYNVTLRQGSSLDFVGTELVDDEVTLIVRNGVLVDVIVSSNGDNLADYEVYTVDELFQHIFFEAQYDSVYGFPTRIVGWRGWAIEVTNFQPQSSTQSLVNSKDKTKWLSNNNPSV
ncbi:MAG: DUF6174 domain-containing protein [Chloroflexota bacterium]